MCKGSNTTTQTSSYKPSPEAASQYSDILGRINDLPFGSYQGPLTAGFNPQQQQGVENINQFAQFAQPGVTSAQGYATGAANPLNAGQIQQYMDPYLNSVVGSTMNAFNIQNQQQQQNVLGNAASQGALGGNRVGVAQANLAALQSAQQAPVIAGLYSQGYNQALNTAGQQFQQNPLQAAGVLGNLSLAGQQGLLQGAGAQLGAGTQQQATTQAEYDAMMRNWLLPYSQLGSQGQIAAGVGSQMGGTGTAQTTAPPPSMLSQIAGLGIAGAGLAGGLGWKPFAASGGRINGYADGGTPMGVADPFSVNPAMAGVAAPQPVDWQRNIHFVDPAKQKGPLEMMQEAKQLAGWGGSSSGSASRPLQLGVGSFASSPVGSYQPMGMSPESGFGAGPIYWKGGGVSGYADGGSPWPDDLPPGLAPAVEWAESGNNPNAINPRTGAAGPMQIMEATSRDPGFGVAAIPPGQIMDPDVNRRFGQQYLGAMIKRYGDTDTALAAYNWGPGNVDKWIAAGGDPNALPAETQNYIAKVKSRLPSQQMAAGPMQYAADQPISGVQAAFPATPSGPASFADRFAGEPQPTQPNMDIAGVDLPMPGESPVAGFAPSAAEALPLGATETAGVAPIGPEQERNIFGLPKLSDEARIGMIAAGLGIAAGKSPHALTNIGAGGLQGVKVYSEARQARRLEEQAKLAQSRLDEQMRHQRVMEQRPIAMPPGSALMNPVTLEKVSGTGQTTWSPEAIRAGAIRYARTGTLPPNLSRRDLATTQAIQDDAIKWSWENNIDPADWPRNWQQYKSEGTSLTRFMSGPQGNTIRSLGVVVDHLGTLRNLALAMQNGNIQLFNRVAQEWARQTGSQVPTNLRSASQIVGTELIKALGVTGAGTESERKHVGEIISTASSPDQILGAIDTTIRPLMAGQLKGLRRQFTTSTGLPESKFNELMPAEAMQFLDPKPTEGAAKSISTKAEYDALPSGANYVNAKDGKTYRKP